jgi:hypothetical protein
VKALLGIFPNLEPDDVRSTSMGVTGEDIQLSPAARKVFPYQVEAKNKATSQVHTYYDQARTHGKYEPLVIVKKDRDIPLAIVSLDHFLKLVQKKEKVDES